ncbi:hypothetical protein EBH_0002640 [Eimeria brunetti]|uniref:Uncharacterized protein n=1 Tax=Eimeria brunetti TaxID=51314 RepID=U6LW75_9EIME|nr:hypothetical protein EBH_0002640 [Eimeria brunetti]
METYGERRKDEKDTKETKETKILERRQVQGSSKERHGRQGDAKTGGHGDKETTKGDTQRREKKGTEERRHREKETEKEAEGCSLKSWQPLQLLRHDVKQQQQQQRLQLQRQLQQQQQQASLQGLLSEPSDASTTLTL